MTVADVAPRGISDIVVANGQRVAPTETLHPTPGLVAQYTGSLVVARRLDEQGGLAYMDMPNPVAPLEGLAPDEMMRQLAEATAPRVKVPVPPYVGTLRKLNDHYFAIEQLHRVTAVVPYASEPFPYLTQFAEIVE